MRCSALPELAARDIVDQLVEVFELLLPLALDQVASLPDDEALVLPGAFLPAQGCGLTLISMDRPEGLDLLLSRAEARRRRRDERARELRARSELAARRLADEFGATRVVLFGTVARGAVHERSDVDLAVWGLPPAREGAASAMAGEVLAAPVDLVCMEGAPESLRRRVEAEGVVLVTGG
jgi:predicted nucleotidyltransferase